MNINRYALRKERSLQKIISKQPKPNTTAIGVCSETQVTHHIITKRSDECLPISVYVPKHKEGDGKKFPVIIDIYGGDFVAGRSALNRNFGAWCAEHGYLTFIPEYTTVPETNLFGQLGDLLKAFNAYFAKETAATAQYRDRQGRLVLDDIHDLPEVVEKVFAGHPEFTHTFFHEGN